MAALLLLAAALAGAACGPRRGDARPDLVVVVLDTLRADRVSSYGYPRPTTPHLDALAARGIRFANASATSIWTVPSHASLFTGLYPIAHGATQERPRLGASVPTLAGILRAHGYATLGVSANPLVGPATGLDRGFERFVPVWRAGAAGGGPDRGEHPLVAAVRRELASLDPARPLLLFANLIEPHHPYTPPPPLRDRFLRRAPGDPAVARALALGAHEWYVAPERVAPETLAAMSDLYDGEVAAADQALAALLEALDDAGRLERALVAVTSDHGEAFGEHGHLRHLFQLHTTLVRIPLVLLPPDGLRGGAVRDEPVSLVDLFATLAAAAGVSLPAGHPGRDLLAWDGRREAPVYAEYYYPVQALSNLPDGVLAAHPRAFAPFRRRLRSVERDGFRLIASSAGPPQLFELARDPGERVDRAGEPALAATRAELAALLEAFGRARPLDAPPPALPDGIFGALDARTEAELRALGYLR